MTGSGPCDRLHGLQPLSRWMLLPDDRYIDIFLMITVRSRKAGRQECRQCSSLRSHSLQKFFIFCSSCCFILCQCAVPCLLSVCFVKVAARVLPIGTDIDTYDVDTTIPANKGAEGALNMKRP